MSQHFTRGGQSIGVSALASVLPMNAQDWSPLEWVGLISLQSKRLSRVFSNTTVQNPQFFGTQLSSQSNSHIHMWPLNKRITQLKHYSRKNILMTVNRVKWSNEISQGLTLQWWQCEWQENKESKSNSKEHINKTCWLIGYGAIRRE